MQLQHHLAQVSEQLAAAAALGDDRTKEIAGALAAAASPAVRLALLSAVSEAADEITAALLDYPGAPAVSVHVDGEDIALEVRATHPGAEQQEAPRRDEGDPNARISLRLTEALKAEIDAAAERDGISVNTWLVRAATQALQPNPFQGFAAAFGPGFAANFGGPGRGRGRGDQHITGWING
jgi:uncharacterized protein (DUF1778 family)